MTRTAGEGVRALVVVTGDELLRGFIQDANSGFLARKLRELGVDLREIRFAPDGLAAIEQALRDGCELADAQLVVVTGGLGPTHDDRTSQAVANVTERPLELDVRALQLVESRARALGRMRDARDSAVFEPGNRKQATVPCGSIVLEPHGTAPAFVTIATDGTVFVVLPGPPGELRHGWRQAVASAPVQELLRQVRIEHERTLRVFSVPESLAVRELEGEGHVDSDACRVTLCARDGELELSIRGNDVARIDGLVTRLRSAFGAQVFAVDDERSTPELVGSLLASHGLQVGLAESCTGGMLGSLLTETAGASAWLRGGIICYHNDVKRDVLGIPQQLIDTYGAVSSPVAEAMARGAQIALEADAGLAITGIAGPTGGTEEKPVGTVHIAVALHDKVEIRHLQLQGNRDAIRLRSSIAVLHLVRRMLDGTIAG